MAETRCRDTAAWQYGCSLPRLVTLFSQQWHLAVCCTRSLFGKESVRRQADKLLSIASATIHEMCV